ncbi:MAG: cystatin domain-containing protein [Planctomycetaceae bacterium]
MRAVVAGCEMVLVAIVAVVVNAAVPGGWSKASVKDPAVVAAATFAVAARQAGGDQGGANEKLALEEIVAAEQQVVAGMNLRLTLRVKVGDDVRRAEATVWSRPWLEDEKERNQLTGWRFLDEAARPGST